MPKIEMQNKIYSNDFYDLVVAYQGTEENLSRDFPLLGSQAVGGGYAVLHVDKTLFPSSVLSTVGYTTIPKLYTTLDSTSLEVSGILRTQNQPILNLKGENILMGFIDTGIDYTLDAFRKSDGSTRILGMWDQTERTDDPPDELFYGKIYTRDDINTALASDNPISIVPETDENGHGTFLAGVAAGSADPEQDFVGAAPMSDIAVVKLKTAKQYLKDFFFVAEDALAFQESDIMTGIYYLYNLAIENNMPLVICIALGSNQGDHSGASFLDSFVSFYSNYTGIFCVVAAGNEAGMGHHFYGKIAGENQFQTAEILVDKDTKGFSLEVWAQAPELYSVSVTSPLGETIPAVPARLGQSTVERLVLEKTVIYIDYEIVEFTTGSQLILIRFENPTPGLWNISVINNIFINGIFHMWLPITGLIPPGTVFLTPNPDTTLTSPSAADSAITISTYNAYDNSLFINSSRGYTRTGAIKPDIAAPGVNVYGPTGPGRYSPRTGSSLAAALAAGSVALLINWGLTRYTPHVLSTQEVKNFLIRGADRSENLLYPNREWGYGTLNVYRIFEILR